MGHFFSEQTCFLLSVLPAADNLENNPVVNPLGRVCEPLLRQSLTLDFINYLYIRDTTVFVIHYLVKGNKFGIPSTFLEKDTLSTHAIYSEIVLHWK